MLSAGLSTKRGRSFPVVGEGKEKEGAALNSRGGGRRTARADLRGEGLHHTRTPEEEKGEPAAKGAEGKKGGKTLSPHFQKDPLWPAQAKVKGRRISFRWSCKKENEKRRHYLSLPHGKGGTMYGI